MSTTNKHFDVDAAQHRDPHCCGVKETDKIREMAVRRREALQRFMDERGTNPNEWAGKAGMTTGNAIYNFLSGDTRSLAYTTYIKLAQVYAVPVGVLTGDPVSPEEMAEAQVIALYRQIDEGRRATAIQMLEVLANQQNNPPVSPGRSSKKRTG